MRVTDYITEQERKEYCKHCHELCGRVCVIWRKAEMRYNAEEEREKKENEQ